MLRSGQNEKVNSKLMAESRFLGDMLKHCQGKRLCISPPWIKNDELVFCIRQTVALKFHISSKEMTKIFFSFLTWRRLHFTVALHYFKFFEGFSDISENVSDVSDPKSCLPGSAYRECMDNGTWALKSNYSNCEPILEEKVSVILQERSCCPATSEPSV